MIYDEANKINNIFFLQLSNSFDFEKIQLHNFRNGHCNDNAKWVVRTAEIKRSDFH